MGQHSFVTGAKALTSSSSLRSLKGVYLTTLKSKVVVTLYVFTHAKTTQMQKEREKNKADIPTTQRNYLHMSFKNSQSLEDA